MKCLPFQINYYNSIGDRWQQLDLMQVYLNEVNISMVIVDVIRAGYFGTPSFLETYAVQHKRGGLSIWDNDYYDYLVAQMLNPNETDDRVIDAVRDMAEEDLQDYRQDYLDNLLERMNILTEFDTSKLTTEQKIKFNEAKENLAKNCLGAALLGKVTKVNVEMGATLGSGEYNPNNNVIKFKSNGEISSDVLGAELFHAFQQQLYGTLSDIVNGTKPTGGSNMEFEEKAFNIMRDMLSEEIAGDQGISVKLISYPEETTMLYNWLVELQFSHQESPINLSQSELDDWFDALKIFQEFHENNHDHYGDPIDFNQNPDAILKLINQTLESNCN